MYSIMRRTLRFLLRCRYIMLFMILLSVSVHVSAFVLDRTSHDAGYSIHSSRQEWHYGQHVQKLSLGTSLSSSSSSVETAVIRTTQQEDVNRRIADVLAVAAAQHATDVAASLQTNLLAEKDLYDASSEWNGVAIPKELPFEWRNKKVSVIETTLPILDDISRQIILESAANYWERKEKEQESLLLLSDSNTESSSGSSGGTSSRFTLQGPNKREVHVSDLRMEAIQTINAALASILYPMLRRAFGRHVAELCRPDENDDDDDDDDTNDSSSSSCWSLLLYDALVIEYDATTLSRTTTNTVAAAAASDDERPSQPLHRDLGLFSVNIALNDPSEFQGGGTVFERLLLHQHSAVGGDAVVVVDEDAPTDGLLAENPLSSSSSSSSSSVNSSPAILPRRAGHAVAHPSRERHAGGALISGRRTILVLFVTATATNNDMLPNNYYSCTKLELAARCKSLGMMVASGSVVPTVPFEDESSSSPPPLKGKQDQIVCYRAAVQCDPSDGEAWLYLAMALMSQSCDSVEETAAAYQEAIKCLEFARKLNPADGRVHNTLGIALQRQKTLQSEHFSREEDIRSSFFKAATLHKNAAIAGCKGAASEARSALLNLGLWHANHDEFEDAVSILRQVCVDGVLADRTTTSDLSSDYPLDVREFEAKRIVQDAKVLLAFCEKQIPIY